MPAIGQHFAIIDRVDSTNNYAMQQVHAGLAAHGQGWFALEQHAGRGQRGKIWHSAPGENIILSLVFDTSELAFHQSFRLSAAVAVAVQQCFEMLAGSGVSIKWPNDLYFNDRKAGGILIENSLQAGKWKWAVVGLGININQVNFDNLNRATSLALHTGQAYDAVALAKTLCIYLQKTWQQLLTGGWPQIFNAYNTHLYGRGQQFRLKKDNVVNEFTIKGVNESGQLLVKENEFVAYDFGTVEWKWDSGKLIDPEG